MAPKAATQIGDQAQQFSRMLVAQQHASNMVQSNTLQANHQLQIQSVGAYYNTNPPDLHTQDDVENYRTSLLKQTDPTAALQGPDGKPTPGISPLVTQHYLANASVQQAEFVNTKTFQAQAILHKNMQADAMKADDTRAQAMSMAGPSQYGLYKQQGLDAIAAQNKPGPNGTGALFNDAETKTRQEAFLNKADLYSASQFAHDSPGPAAKLLADPTLTARQFPNLKPAQAMGILSQANKQLNAEDNTSDRAFKELRNNAGNEVIDMLKTGNVDTGRVAQLWQKRLISENDYATLIGHPPPAQDNPAAAAAYMSRLNDPNLDAPALDQLLSHVKGDSSMSGPTRAAVAEMIADKKAGMNSPLANARKQGSADGELSLGNFLSTSAIGSSTSAYAITHKAEIRQQTIAAKAQFEAALSRANNPADVDNVVKTFDWGTYIRTPGARPASPSSSSKPSGGSSIAMPAMPPEPRPYPGRVGERVDPTIKNKLASMPAMGTP